MPVFDHKQRTETGEINGHKYVAKNVAPYGFWTITPETGRTPDALIGQFTTINHALEAFTNYTNAKNNEKQPKAKAETVEA